MAAYATELEALNRILIGALSHPATATTDARRDVQNALQILRETDRDIQGEGHFFNTKYNVVYLVYALKVPVADDVFFVYESSGYDRPGHVHPKRETYSIRYTGGPPATANVYDNVNNTFLFTSDSILLNTVSRIPFEELPQYAREYITARAAAEFYENARGERSARLEDREQSARYAFKAVELEIAGFNTFDNPYDSWVHYNR